MPHLPTWRTGLTVAVATLAALLPAIPAGATTPTGVHGTVTLPDGSPAAGVCVSVYDGWHQASQTTGADGTYSLNVPAASDYLLHFADCGGRDLADVYYGGEVASNREPRLAITDGQMLTADQQMIQGGEITGHATDDLGNPVTNAWVYWIDHSVGFDNFGATHVGADGTYVLHDVLPGTWRVFGMGGSYDIPQTWAGGVDNWQQSPPVTVTAGGSAAIDLQMKRPGAITGHVVDENGQPRSDIYVDVYGSTEEIHLAQAHTDDYGNFALGRVFAEPVRLAYSAGQPPYTWSGDADTFAGATAIDVQPWLTVNGIQQTVAHGPHIAGTVTDPSGNPVVGATVQLYDGVTLTGTSRYETTDTAGHYLFPDLPSKLYDVRVTPPQPSPLIGGFYPDELPIATPAGAVIPSDSTDHVDFTLPIGGTIEGTVTRASDGSPAASVCVAASSILPGTGGGTTTASDGTFSLQGLRTADYTLRFNDCGNVRTLAPMLWHDAGGGSTVHVDQGSTVPGIDVAMQRGATLHGRVVDGAGHPVSSIFVMTSGFDSSGLYSYGSAITTNDGTWSIGGLSGATYPVQFTSSDTAVPWVPRFETVTAGTGEDVALPDEVMHHGGYFSGTVTDQSGKPVTDVCIDAVVDNDTHSTVPIWAARTTINGTYTMGPIEAGSYTAYFRDCGAGMVSTYWQPTVPFSPVPTQTFTVSADATTSGVDQEVYVYTLPSVPSNVAVAPGDSSAKLTWSPPADDGHTAITGYAVTTPSGTTTVPATARSYDVGGLTNGHSYQFSVAAINSKGTGDAATAATTPEAGLGKPVTVSLAHPSVLTYGATGQLSGRVLDSQGTAVGGATVTIASRVAGSTASWHVLKTVTASSTGGWSLAIAPSTPTSYRISSGDAVTGGTVMLRPLLAASASQRTVTFTTRPVRANALIVLQRWNGSRWSTWQSLRLNSWGRLVSTLPTAGKWRGWLSATGYWAAAASRNLQLA